MLFRNMTFFDSGVSRESYRFHAIEKWRRNGIQGVRGGDEEDFAKINWNVHIVIVETVVLFWVQYLQHGSRGIAVEVVAADLVDLVEQEDWIGHADLLQPTDDQAWHSSDVGSPVAAD